MASLMLTLSPSHQPMRVIALGRNAWRAPSPEQRLAAAVLAQAVADARVQRNARRRERAIAFQQGADALLFWCAVAGLDPDVIRQKARRWLGESRCAGIRCNGNV